MDISTAKGLMEKAFGLIDEGDHRGAAEIGEKLIAHKFSGGYEVLATALYESGDLKAAIDVLRNGTRQFKKVWLLWDLFGIYLSRDGRHEEALAAFDEAGACSGADGRMVSYNRAAACLAAGENEKAVEICATINSGGLYPPAAILHLEALKRSRDLARLEAAALSFLRAVPVDEENSSDISAMYSYLAYSYLESGSPEKAVEFAGHAFGFSRRNHLALEVVRRARGAVSDSARMFRIVARGRWDAPVFDGDPVPPHFYVTYHVAADDAAEAMAYIREFERPGIRESVSPEEAAPAEITVGAEKGIYDLTGFMFFDPSKK